METKSVLESKRSWLNYVSIIVLGLTAAFADPEFQTIIKETLGFKGVIGLMIGGAILNQFLIQTSTTRPTFQLPKKKEKAKPTHKDRLDMLDPDKVEKQADDDYIKEF